MAAGVSVGLLKEKLKGLSREKTLVLKKRLTNMGINIEFDVFSLVPVDRKIPLPASYVQHRLWFSNQSDQQGDATYNLPIALRLGGVIKPEVLDAAFKYVINRHEALRTTFAVHDGEIIQIIRDCQFKLSVRTVSERAIKQEVKAHAMALFDLESGPLIKAELLQISAIENVLLINLHHIISDGWSQNSLLLPELFAAYRAIDAQREAKLPPLSVQYGDYAYWQRQKDMSVHLNYWKAQLAGYGESVLIPTDFPRTGAAGSHIKLLTRPYDMGFSQRLDRFGRAHGCTLFMTLLAGFAVVLHRYTQRKDMCIGVTTAGRNMPQLEPLIGFFINILPLRVRLSGSLSVREFMAAVRQTTLTAFEHQDLPFEHLNSELTAQRDVRAGSLVPLILRHQNFPRVKVEDVLPSELTLIARLDEPNNDEALDMKAKCEIDFAFYGGGHQPLEVLAEYDADLFKRESIERLLGHVDHVLLNMMDNSEQQLQDIPLLNDQEMQLMLSAGDGPALEQALNSAFNVVTQFEKHTAATPDAIACYAGTRSINYGDLNTQANRLAHYLIALGVGAESVVGVYLERSIETLVALLAIFKAGGAYVPLDVNYPQHYLELMIENAGLVQIICNDSTEALLPPITATIVNIDTLADVLAVQSEFNSGVKLMPDQLAYILYTSGSTGTPKGVEVPHAQVTNCLQNYCTQFPLDSHERVAQRTTTAFAVSVKELFAALVSGASVVVVADDVSKDPVRLAAAIKDYGVTRLSIVPSHLEALLGSGTDITTSLSTLRYCITAGEPLAKSVADRFRQLLPASRLLNNYGCTECNDITYQDVFALEGDYQFVPVGFPIANTEVYVLDAQLQPVPIGVPGELCVAGQSVPKGYRGRPDLTAEKFIDHPFSTIPGKRLFKTGDYVKRLASGALEYLGRQDLQVKVRGSRVDARQVEYVMSLYPGVNTPIASHSPEGDQLVGYFTEKPDSPVDRVQFKRHLSGQLPGYMVPDIIVRLDNLPRLPNGKVDRRNLPSPVTFISENIVAPETDTEKTVAAIWAKVLNMPVENIGRDDTFFGLGGHSLSALKVVSILKQEFSLKLSIKSFYNQNTLSECAQHVKKTIDQHASSTAQISNEYEHPLLPNNYRVFERRNRNHYNLTSLLEIKKGSQHEAYIAMRGLMNSHDALRSIWVNKNDDWFVKVQSIDKVQDWFEETTIPLMREEGHSAAIKAKCNYYQRTMDIEKTTVRVVYIHLKAGARDRILFIFHHLVMDAYSFNIFTEDFVSLFLAAMTGSQFALQHSDSVASVATHLKDYAIYQSPRKFEYWRSLPWDEIKQPPIDEHAWAKASTVEEVTPRVALSEISQHYSELFLTRVKESGFSEIHYLILVVVLAYKKWSGSSHLFFTLVNNGRYYPDANLDFTRTIGWLSQYPQVFIKTDEFSSIPLALNSIKTQLDVMSNDELSFTCLKHMVSDDVIKSEMGKLPPVQLDLNYMPSILTTDYADLYSRENLLSKAHESRGDNDGMMKKDFTPIEIVSFVEGKLNFSCSYSDAMYTEKCVRAFVETQAQVLMNILDGKDMACVYDSTGSSE
jgi:amino acid adenylation domain-containing protein